MIQEINLELTLDRSHTDGSLLIVYQNKKVER